MVLLLKKLGIAPEKLGFASEKLGFALEKLGVAPENLHLRFWDGPPGQILGPPGRHFGPGTILGQFWGPPKSDFAREAFLVGR